MTKFRVFPFAVWVFAFTLLWATPGRAQQSATSPALDVYRALKSFDLGGGSALAENLVLKRDRAEMTFSGTFYFEAPVEGKVRGAVFMGRGTFRAEPPPSVFEKENLRRLLKADTVESTFETAVLRFTDDTFEIIGRDVKADSAPQQAAKLAAEFEPRLLKETGANVSARLAISILNGETPGFFLAQFDKGKLNRFTFLMDHQCRIPATNFEVNGGERGMIFAYRKSFYGNDIWLAFHALRDYDRGHAEYSDVYETVAIRRYRMDVDLRNYKKILRLMADMNVEVRAGGLRAFSLSVNESLSEYEDARLKKAMKLRGARLDGSPVDVVQEDWEGGLTIYLPSPRRAGEKFSVQMELEGDFIVDAPALAYPRSSTGWYPRHGYLPRSTYEISFLHKKEHKVACGGLRVKEEPVPESKSDVVTMVRFDQPIALVSFGLGQFERHALKSKIEEGKEISIEFYSLPGSLAVIKEDFMLAEMDNSLRFFNQMFGGYPYPSFGGVFRPFPYGQGFASMLFLPRADRDSPRTFVFISHETAHQWWGNIVAWRSYRDQWLSEGFAEYSGIWYTGIRDRTKNKARKDLIDDLRRSLAEPPVTETGIGKGRVADIGPLVLGTRLISRETFNAYGILIYNKGALVLRMLHFLFTDPQTGNGQPFWDMMADFVRRYSGKAATTENFIAVANEHFVRTPVAQRYKIKDLNWFFEQYVYRTELPSYTLTYRIEPQPDGSAMLKGVLEQTGVPQEWFMPLPLVLRLGKDQEARGLVAAIGPRTEISIKIPGKPEEVRLDPDLWIMSEKTNTRKQ